jgi:molybdenum cofactor cytidylyltransferase
MGKRGHPPLVSMKIRSSILEWRGNGGLRGLLQEWESSAVDVETADEYVLADMDTPQQYEELLAGLADYDVPSIAECEVLLSRKLRVDSRIISHSSKVAQIALHLTRELNKKGCNLNVKLIAAAALLHDMAKGQPDHPAVAARILSEWGYPGVAAVVRTHMDPPTQQRQQISHEEVVCLADKMVQGDRMVTVEERFQNRARTGTDLPAVEARVSQRRAHILAIRERLGRVLGSPVESFFLPDSSVPSEAPDEGLSPETR